jgi:DNA-binding HxlR family transcriptional regulator
MQPFHADRLKSLTDAGLLERVTGSTGRGEYRLSDKGTALWSAARALLAWGDEYYAPEGPRRVFQHAADSDDDVATAALARPHLLLTPVR